MILPFTSFLKGENSNISPLIQSPEQPSVLNGVTNSFKIGALTKDTGYSRVGGQIQANKNITGLYHFIQNSTTEKMLATVDDATSDDTQLFYRADGSGAWTEITAAETAWANVAGAKVEMQGFIGYCFFVGYSETDGFLPVGSLTGTTFSTSTNVTSMPQAKYIVKYDSRLYLLNVKYGGTHYPTRVVASSVPSAGAITWDTSGLPSENSGGFFDVDYDLEITGGAAHMGRLIVFTNDNAYVYDRTSFKEAWSYGCTNHRTIKKSGSYLLWANNDGVFLSTGGQPQNIGGEIIDFIRNGNPKDFFAEIVDEVYHLYVGTVTVNGVTYSNCVKKFNIATSTWEGREYYNTITAFGRYRDSNYKKRLYMGTSTGEVFDKAKYTDSTLVSGDAQTTAGTGGQPIAVNFELAPFVVDISSQEKIKKLIAYAERAQGLVLKARVIDQYSQVLMPYEDIGKLETFITELDVNVKKGVILQIAGFETSTDPYFSFYGFALEIEKYSKQPK